MRTGLVMEKVGMSRLFLETGDSIPVTVLKMEQCCVVGHKTKEKHGYDAVQVGAGYIRPSLVSKPMRGVFSKAEVEPRRHLCEFRVDQGHFVSVGQELKVSHFAVGQYVDVAGQGLGKGFAGGMKRWNFKGLRASHGVSLTHRSSGSTGQRQDPGKVFKGKKMPGRLGGKRISVQSLKVVKFDESAGLLFVHGSVPGVKGGCLYVKDAVKKVRKE